MIGDEVAPFSLGDDDDDDDEGALAGMDNVDSLITELGVEPSGTSPPPGAFAAGAKAHGHGGGGAMADRKPQHLLERGISENSKVTAGDVDLDLEQEIEDLLLE